MFSGKTEKLIEIYEDLKKDKIKAYCFKPSLDTRDIGIFKSHNDDVISCWQVKSFIDLIKRTKRIEKDEVILIDEFQFFRAGTKTERDTLVKQVQELATKCKKIIMAGLDLDFRAKPFGATLAVAEIAGKVHALKAECFKCGKEAKFTAKLFGNKKIIEVGSEQYVPVCSKHFKIDWNKINKLQDEISLQRKKITTAEDPRKFYGMMRTKNIFSLKGKLSRLEKELKLLEKGM
jgi:thymidine kinase